MSLYSECTKNTGVGKHYIFDKATFENLQRDSNTITSETAKALLSPGHDKELL